MIAAMAKAKSLPGQGIEARIAGLDAAAIAAALDADGHAVIPGLLQAAECRALAALYDAEDGFRSRVVMARHGYGRGEYRYFSYPLPGIVAGLRGAFYPLLAPVADRWHEAMKLETRFPSTHDEFLRRCHGAGQRRCCCATGPATTTACIRTSTARMSFRCRSPSCCPIRRAISKAASSCSPSSVRACSRGCRWCR